MERGTRVTEQNRHAQLSQVLPCVVVVHDESLVSAGDVEVLAAPVKLHVALGGLLHVQVSAGRGVSWS